MFFMFAFNAFSFCHSLGQSVTGVTLLIYSQEKRCAQKIYGTQTILLDFLDIFYKDNIYLKCRLRILKNYFVSYWRLSFFFLSFCTHICMAGCLFSFSLFLPVSFNPYVSFTSLLWTISPCFYRYTAPPALGFVKREDPTFYFFLD